MKPAIPSVDRSVVVRLAPADAFDLFTREMHIWWPFVGHSCSDADAQDVHFEPRVGGVVIERARGGRQFVWGTLAEWDPPRGFAMSWHPGLPVDEATRLRVSFTARDGGTEVRVLHEGWEARGADAAAKRDQYDGGWPITLAAFAAVAAARSPA
jgi:uncharacterized protein YndB with AHSA1/START domain